MVIVTQKVLQDSQDEYLGTKNTYLMLQIGSAER